MIESYSDVNVHKTTHVELMAAIIVILLPFYKCSERYIRSLAGPSTLSLIPPSTLHCIIISAFALQPSSPLKLVYPVPLPQEALPEKSGLYKGI